ncbi:MAG: hypothetical protein V9G20_10885 [Candidatus Promineifilaceae bacterium]
MRTIIVISLLCVATLSACSFNQEQTQHDTLLVWERDRDNNHCSVWLIEPEQQSSEKILADARTCNFAVADIGGVPHLVYWEQLNEMIIYAINIRDRKLNIQQVITLNDMEFSTLPQWDKEENIYFGAIVDGVEQIVRVDQGTKTPSSFIKQDNGFATEPIISPDGRFFVYWTLDGPTSRTSQPYCITGCRSGYYHIYNIEKVEDISLIPFIRQIRDEQLAYHENAQWSPTGQFLAFQLDVRGAGGILIFDMNKTEIVADLKTDMVGDMKIVGWASDTELVYMAQHYFPETGYSLARPYIYSLDNKTAWELFPDLPAKTEEDQPYIFYDFDLAMNDKHFVGVLPPPNSTDGKTASLFIANIDQSPPNVDMISITDQIPGDVDQWSPFTNPTWSISGEWLAYYSEYLTADGIPQADLFIISRDGEMVPIDIGLKEVLSRVQYTWIQSE